MSMSRNVHVVVIDSGLSKDAFFESELDYDSLKVNCNEDCFFMSEESDDKLGHGTSVMNVFYQHCPDIKYTVISVYDEEIFLDEDKLLYTLEYIYKNISCDVINISSGLTIAFRKNELEEICNKIAAKGIFIVAAYDNLGAISYPAYFESVIGVDGDLAIKKSHEYYINKGSRINIVGSFAERLLVEKNNKKIMRNGTSFIAPYISSKIANYLKVKKMNIDQIYDKLEADSIGVCDYNNKLKMETEITINKAVVFPLNKEIDVLCRNQDLLHFEISCVCDLKYFGRVGKYLDYENKKLFVENIDKLDWSKDFDWFILGHIMEIKDILKYDLVNIIIKNCLTYKKNLYVFDYQLLSKKIISEFKRNGLQIYCPTVLKTDFPFNNIGKMYNSVTPIIGIFGTSSKQGKYTMQLNFRRILLNRGFIVGQIGTEPTALLFGMDYSIPTGYNAMNELNENELAVFINDKIRKLEEEQNDIIIVGSQSQTIPYDYSNIKCLTMYQQSLLVGTRPDGVVLCVNAFDEVDYIKRTVKYIESICETKVLAIAISTFSDMGKWTVWGNSQIDMDDERLSKLARRLECLNIPVFVLSSQEEYEKIVDTCLCYLSND